MNNLKTKKDYLFDDLIDIITNKISSNSVSKKNYISTENMLPNCTGVEIASSLPEVKNYNHFLATDTLFSNIRTYFRKVWFATHSGGASADVLIFRSKDNSILCPDYLYYIISDKTFVDYTSKTSKEGAKMPRGDKNAIIRFPISLPDISEQKNIGSILVALDKKIQSNQRINKTLEDIGKAIFKSWFVDFDPVRAKIERCSTGLPDEISTLFPSEMLNSEIGEIPQGWDNVKISDLGDVVCGKTPSTKNPLNFGGDFPFITIPDMRRGLVNTNSERKISQLGANSLKGKMLPAGSICVSCIATPGLVTLTTKDSFTNQQINSIIPKSKNACEYLLFAMLNFGETIKSAGGGGSVFANLKTSGFKNLSIMSPNKFALEKFSEITKPILGQMQLLATESNTLANLRDTLSPKLMSGQILINDAKKIIESVI